MSGLLDRLQQCNYILEMVAACLLFALPLKNGIALGCVLGRGRLRHWW